jgi:hypothetical protein
MRRWSSDSLSHNHLHTHIIRIIRSIRSSTIRNLPRWYQTEQCPDKTVDTVHTNLLCSFWPSNQSRSVTSGKIEWAHLPVSTKSYFPCHALINLAKLWKSLEDNGLSKMVPSNAACCARTSTSSFPTSPRWNRIYINFTSISFWHRLQHNPHITFIQRVSLMCNFPRQHNLDRTQAIGEN